MLVEKQNLFIWRLILLCFFAARKKEAQITKAVPPHIVIDSDDDNAQITKVTPAHPRYRLQRALRNASKMSVDKNVLEGLPYFNASIRVNETDKIEGKKQFLTKSLNSYLQTMTSTILNIIIETIRLH